MDIPTSTVVEEFHEAESFKTEIEQTPQHFPAACHYIESWEKTTVFPEQLENLDIYVNTKIKNTGPDGTLSIFRELGTTNMGEIARKLEHLKSLKEPSIQMWLSRITPNMEEMILSSECPPILLITPKLINYGNVPDGNHRALAALDLANRGKKDISLTAYVGKLNNMRWLMWNTGIYFRGSTISSQEKNQIIQCRFRNQENFL